MLNESEDLHREKGSTVIRLTVFIGEVRELCPQSRRFGGETFSYASATLASSIQDVAEEPIFTSIARFLEVRDSPPLAVASFPHKESLSLDLHGCLIKIDKKTLRVLNIKLGSGETVIDSSRLSENGPGFLIRLLSLLKSDLETSRNTWRESLREERRSFFEGFGEMKTEVKAGISKMIDAIEWATRAGQSYLLFGEALPKHQPGENGPYDIRLFTTLSVNEVLSDRIARSSSWATDWGSSYTRSFGEPTGVFTKIFGGLGGDSEERGSISVATFELPGSTSAPSSYVEDDFTKVLGGWRGRHWDGTKTLIWQNPNSIPFDSLA